MPESANETGIVRKVVIRTVRTYAIHAPDEAGATEMLESFLKEAHPTMSNSRSIASADPIRSVQALALDRPHNSWFDVEAGEANLISVPMDRQVALNVLQIMETAERKAKKGPWWARLVGPSVSLFINDLKRALVPG